MKKARDQEKERKKAEKLQKLVDKIAKQAVAQPAAAQEKSKIKELPELPTYVDATPEGEKKILVELDDERLKAYNPTQLSQLIMHGGKRWGSSDPHLAQSFVIIDPTSLSFYIWVTL